MSSLKFGISRETIINNYREGVGLPRLQPGEKPSIKLVAPVKPKPSRIDSKSIARQLRLLGGTDTTRPITQAALRLAQSLISNRNTGKPYFGPLIYAINPQGHIIYAESGVRLSHLGERKLPPARELLQKMQHPNYVYDPRVISSDQAVIADRALTIIRKIWDA